MLVDSNGNPINKTALEKIREDKKKFTCFEHKDGIYSLFENTPSLHQNVTYLGEFTIHSNKKDFVYNGERYVSLWSMADAMKEDLEKLPHDPAVYDPNLRLSWRITLAISDYLQSIGLQPIENTNDEYAFLDPSGCIIFTVSFEVKEDDSGKGVVRRFSSNNATYGRAEFEDLDSAIAACNSLIASFTAGIVALGNETLSKMTEARANKFFEYTIKENNLSNISILVTDLKKKTIEMLERELKLLKGDEDSPKKISEKDLEKIKKEISNNVGKILKENLL